MTIIKQGIQGLLGGLIGGTAIKAFLFDQIFKYRKEIYTGEKNVRESLSTIKYKVHDNSSLLLLAGGLIITYFFFKK